MEGQSQEKAFATSTAALFHDTSTTALFHDDGQALLTCFPPALPSPADAASCRAATSWGEFLLLEDGTSKQTGRRSDRESY